MIHRKSHNSSFRKRLRVKIIGTTILPFQHYGRDLFHQLNNTEDNYFNITSFYKTNNNRFNC